MKKLLLFSAVAFLITSCGNAGKSANDNQDSLSASTMIEDSSAPADPGLQATDSTGAPSDSAATSNSQTAEKQDEKNQTGSEYGDLVDQFAKNVKNSTYNFKHDNWAKAEKLETKAWKQADKIKKVKGKLTPDELKKFNKAYNELNRNADLWQ